MDLLITFSTISLVLACHSILSPKAVESTLFGDSILGEEALESWCFLGDGIDSLGLGVSVSGGEAVNF